MNEVAHRTIIEFLSAHKARYVELEHAPSKTSEESHAVRAQAGYPNAVGAKALLAKLYFKDSERFATIVLPGNHTLD